jgi:hypothetical protein
MGAETAAGSSQIFFLSKKTFISLPVATFQLCFEHEFTKCPKPFSISLAVYVSSASGIGSAGDPLPFSHFSCKFVSRKISRHGLFLFQFLLVLSYT